MSHVSKGSASPPTLSTSDIQSRTQPRENLNARGMAALPTLLVLGTIAEIFIPVVMFRSPVFFSKGLRLALLGCH